MRSSERNRRRQETYDYLMRMIDLSNVNDHEREEVLQARIAELESALQEARLQLEYLGEKFGNTGTGTTVLARINMVLAGKESRR